MGYRVYFLLGLITFAFVATLGGCGKTAPTPEFEYAEAELNPSGNAPLAAVCSVATAVPVRATLVVEGGYETIALDSGEEYATSHEFVVLGLRPDTTHTLRVEVTSEEGGTAERILEVTTSPLPAYIAPMELVTADTARMEPGYTMVPLMRWPNGILDDNFGLITIVNDAGEIVWYYKIDYALSEVRRASNGNLWYQYGRSGNMAEIDMLGNTVREWHTTGIPKDVPAGSIPVDTDSFHHDFWEMPSGNILTLSTELRYYEKYPSRPSDPDKNRKESNVVGDVIIEFTPEGKIVREWNVFEILDPFRVTRDSMSAGFWATTYKDVAGQREFKRPGKDWTHTNSIVQDPSDDSAIMSVYHQEMVYKLDLNTGEIKWMLGDKENWKAPWSSLFLEPIGDTMLQKAQHAAKLTPQGTLILYDNGTHRWGREDKGKRNFSRAVEFEIDEEAMTVRQVWEYGGREGEWFFSPFISDVDWLPQKQNILITDGGRVRNSDGEDSASPIGGHHWSRIVEVTHTQPAEIVFELVIDDEPPEGWAVYRAERLPSLYP